MVVNNIKIFLKMKNKGQFNIKKILQDFENRTASQIKTD